MTLEVVEETVGLIKARVMVNNIKEWLEMAIITAIQAPVKRIMEAGSKHTHTHTYLWAKFPILPKPEVHISGETRFQGSPNNVCNMLQHTNICRMPFLALTGSLHRVAKCPKIYIDQLNRINCNKFNT